MFQALLLVLVMLISAWIMGQIVDYVIRKAGDSW